MPKLAPRLISALRRKVRPKHEVTVADAGHLVELAHWTERAPLRLMVPASMLRMQGAYAYGPGHPFVRALSDGRQALEAFYEAVQPDTICNYYGVEGGGRAGHDLPPWELPWYLRKSRTPPPGELGLGAEHGVSFYGPATAEKIDLEFQRLSGLRDAVARDGFDPDGHGDIEGFVMRDGADACFFVRGGKHRAAVLTALGHAQIPVSFRTSFPRVVDRAQAAFWPLVRGGQMDEALAAELLSVYVRGRDAKTVEAG